MQSEKNFFQRAVNAIVDGRTRQAQRFVAQYNRDHGIVPNKVNGR